MSDIDLDQIVLPFQDRIRTKLMRVGGGLLPESGRLLGEVLPTGPALIVADDNTMAVAGDAVEASWRGAGRQCTVLRLEPPEGHDTVRADDAAVEQVLSAIGDHRSVIAVGSGTVNDLGKMAAYRAGVVSAVVATAPSMNGYTSSIAAILSDGVKTTQACDPPLACLADTKVMAEAPYRMIASGFGDLLSKPVSNADWQLGSRLAGADYFPEVIDLVNRGAALLEGVPARLPTRDPDAAGRLTASLLVSGLAMSVAGSSSPASGGEHLISHYIDMTHYAFGEPNDLHGCQVGVATITSAAIYERLLALDPASIDIDELVARHPTWEETKRGVAEHFGVLADAVLGHAEQAYTAHDELRLRLETLVCSWGEIMAAAGESLLPAATISADLAAAECPLTFDDIGVVPARAHRALRWCRFIRARYTILHLAAELGMLAQWSNEVLRQHHGLDPLPASKS